MKSIQNMEAHNTQTSDGSAGGPPMRLRRLLPRVVRILLGLMFFMFGLNGFLNFIPQPETPMPEAAVAFARALAKTGYMMPLVMGTQLIAGTLLLLNLFVPLALALLAPIIVGIISFHLFLVPATIGPGIAVLVMELYLAWVYRDSFRPMLALRVTRGPN
jgi:uncharacterized membrane protein YphA (DoxX/SURF4 family)